MVDGLHNCLGEIFPLFFQVINLSMSQESTNNQTLLLAVLEAIAAFVNWVPHAYLFAHNFLQGISNLLAIPQTRMVC